MADSDKDILITPQVGASNDPSVVFASGATPADDITLFVTDDGTIATLSFEGSSGQLLSISNDLTGVIFSVNDISGIPSLEVNADGTVSIAEFDGEVGIGTAAPTEMLTIQGRDVVSSNAGIRVNARGDAYLKLLADTVSDTELENAYIYMSQDADAVVSVIGTIGAANVDSQNNTFTGSTNNSLGIHHKFATGTVDIGVNGAVGLTVNDSNGVNVVGAITVGDASLGTVMTVDGGTGGATIARFRRDPGGSADTAINMGGGGGVPYIAVTRDSGTAPWVFGMGTSSDFVIAQDVDTSDTANYRFQISSTAEVKLRRSAGGEMLLLTDTGGAGATANPFIGFDDSAAVRQGYVGFGSTGNQDIYLVSDLGDIRLTAGGGDIRLEDNVAVTGNLTATGDVTADNFEATGLGPLTTPGTDDSYLGGYGIMGSRGTYYVSNVAGAVALNHTGVHNVNTKLVTAADGVDITGDMGSTTMQGLGYHASSGDAPPGADVWVRSNTNGYLYVGWINTVSGTATPTLTRVYTSQDAFLRYLTPQNFVNEMDGLTWTFTGENTTTGGGMTYNDNVKTHYGTGEDADLWFDGLDFYIDLINGADFRLRGGASGTEAMITAVDDGAVVLYHNGTSEFATQQFNLTGETSGANLKDHAGTVRDVGFNHVKEVAMTTANITLDDLHAGTIIRRTGTSTVILTVAATATTAFPVGSMCTVLNHGTAGSLTISDGAESMYVMDGSGTVVNHAGFALAIGGCLTVWRQATNAYYVWGAGIP